MGVYKRLEQVPHRYRLANYQANYEGENSWETFVEQKTETFESTATDDRYEKAGRYLNAS